MLGIDHELIGGAVFRAGFGFSGGGWFWRPVGVHTELLGQMHVASLRCQLAWAAQPCQTLEGAQVNGTLKIQPQKQTK